MKTKAALLLLAAAMTGASYFQLRAQTPPAGPPETKFSYPYGKECIITLDPKASKSVPLSGNRGGPGFESDGTLRGTLVYCSDEWCILQDGVSEKWIPRDKVLVMNAAK